MGGPIVLGIIWRLHGTLKFEYSSHVTSGSQNTAGLSLVDVKIDIRYRILVLSRWLFWWGRIQASPSLE